MECRNVRDRLLTDHLDGELEAAERAGIDAHLAECAVCRELVETVTRRAVTPFKEAGTLRPDDSVWQGIQEKIEAGRAGSVDRAGRLREILEGLLSFPKPVFRVALVTALILVAVVAVQWPSSPSDAAYAYVEEQMTFMEELGSGNTDLLNGDLKDYEAAMEDIAV